jgi:hypothetical protein
MISALYSLVAIMPRRLPPVDISIRLLAGGDCRTGLQTQPAQRTLSLTRAYLYIGNRRGKHQGNQKKIPAREGRSHSDGAMNQPDKTVHKASKMVGNPAICPRKRPASVHLFIAGSIRDRVFACSPGIFRV